MTIECPKCQTNNPDDTAFCGECGNGKAIEHYEKFLPLWKAADPGDTDVDDAKTRLAGLKD